MPKNFKTMKLKIKKNNYTYGFTNDLQLFIQNLMTYVSSIRK